MRENGQGTGINANKIIIEIELFSEIQDWMLGVDVLVSAEQLVNSKVYLSTNSSSMNSAGLKQPNASVTVGNFDKSKSALILNTHDDDAHGGRVEGFFELSTGNGLKYGSNGEMEFYVYVENYSTTNSVYYRANINLKDGGTTPFTITENPKYVTSGTAGTGATVSLLVCKINSQETDLEVNNTTIGIDLFSGIQEWMRGVDVLVNLESAVKSKVYLSTNSSSMNSAGLKQPNASVTVGNFDKSKSALVSNSYDSDNHNGKVESYFELKTGDYGLEYDLNGNMEFYVYVENYSATNSVYYRANINFVNGGTSPFSVTSNPKYVTSGAGTTTSLLVFKIHSQETNLDVKKVTIEIELGVYEARFRFDIKKYTSGIFADMYYLELGNAPQSYAGTTSTINATKTTDQWIDNNFYYIDNNDSSIQYVLKDENYYLVEPIRWIIIADENYTGTGGTFGIDYFSKTSLATHDRAKLTDIALNQIVIMSEKLLTSFTFNYNFGNYSSKMTPFLDKIFTANEQILLETISLSTLNGYNLSTYTSKIALLAGNHPSENFYISTYLTTSNSRKASQTAYLSKETTNPSYFNEYYMRSYYYDGSSSSRRIYYVDASGTLLGEGEMSTHPLRGIRPIVVLTVNS